MQYYLKIQDKRTPLRHLKSLLTEELPGKNNYERHLLPSLKTKPPKKLFNLLYTCFCCILIYKFQIKGVF